VWVVHKQADFACLLVWLLVAHTTSNLIGNLLVFINLGQIGKALSLISVLQNGLHRLVLHTLHGRVLVPSTVAELTFLDTRRESVSETLLESEVATSLESSVDVVAIHARAHHCRSLRVSILSVLQQGFLRLQDSGWEFRSVGRVLSVRMGVQLVYDLSMLIIHRLGHHLRCVWDGVVPGDSGHSLLECLLLLNLHGCLLRLVLC